MKRIHLLVIGLLLCLPIFACAIPQPVDINATATQVAADIFATQTATVPTPTPGPVTVRVAPDGSGDYPALAEAAEAVSPGSTILLDPGTHRLSAPLAINKSLSIKGAGLDQTFVVGENGQYVVRFIGPGAFALEDITFRYEGMAWASVAAVEDGQIDFYRCRFIGGVWSEAEERGGSGLRLLGSTAGTVQECRVEENGLRGIDVQGQAQPTLEGNVCANNAYSSIAYWDGAGGIARQNECSGNGLHGISVDGQAQPTLEENICRDNQEDGIHFSGSSGGVARRNECTGNQLSGILVREQASPTIEENVLTANVEGGIAFLDDAGGTARQNECTGNGLSGILVSDQAQPTLEDNVCQDNEESGVAYFGSAGGLARQNECSGNGLQGIAVEGQAQPALEENVCTDNEQAGIGYAGDSGGTARQNECAGNGFSGIIVTDQAQPTLEDNVCQDNGESGVAYFGSAGGLARQNECSGNGLHGISVNEQAQPTLEENVCSDNQEFGIRFSGSSGGVARRNECTGNQLSGILVREQAQPTVEENVSTDNAECGILFVGQSGGVARGNEFARNKWGIFVEETAGPELINNSYYDNTAADIDDRRTGLLFDDDFGDPGSGWEVGEYPGGNVGYGDGYYFVVATLEDGAMWGITYRDFDDVTVDVDATQVSAPGNNNNAYGVKCRVSRGAEGLGGDGYALLISGDGRYSIQIIADGDYEPLIDWTRSSVVKQGNAANHLRAICDDDYLALIVNGQLLAEARDVTYTAGDIGLLASTLEAEPTEIHFDDLEVYAPGSEVEQ